MTPLGILQPGQTRNNDSYDNKTFSTKMGYDFSDSFSLNVVSRYTASSLGFTGDFDDNFHGPSTICQIGLVAYVDSFLASPLR